MGLSSPPPPLRLCRILVDKLLIRLNSNLVGPLISGLPCLINFWSRWAAVLNFHCFLSSGLSSSVYICRQTTDPIVLKFNWPTHFGPAPAWLIFGCVPLNPSSDSSHSDLIPSRGVYIHWYLVLLLFRNLSSCGGCVDNSSHSFNHTIFIYLIREFSIVILSCLSSIISLAHRKFKWPNSFLPLDFF